VFSENTIDRIDRWATRLNVRPLAALGYRFIERTEDGMLAAKYRLHQARSGTYRVSVGEASAEFGIPTRQEFLDFDSIEERPILVDLIGELRPDDVFYDIGANIGLYTALVADVVDTEVIAFEPHPVNADRLEANVALNDAEVTVYRLALATSNGSTELTLDPGFPLERTGSARHTLLSNYYRHDDGLDTVRVTKQRGDHLVVAEELPPPTVLKIDVEGTEIDVLEGFESILSRPECRLVYCEVHNDRLQANGRSVSDLREFLRDCGFGVESASIRHGQDFLRAEKDDAGATE
jgi:FkbM family methyltransferase